MSNQIKITKEMLEKFISDINTQLPLEEIEALMHAEVEKPEEEMDTELVDMCALILAKAYNPGYEDKKPEKMYRPWEDVSAVEGKKPQKKAIPFRRVLIIAAAVVIFFAVAIPAGAQLFRSKVSDGTVQFYDSFFKIALNKDEPTTAQGKDSVNEMIVDKLDSFLLPEALRSDEYEKSAHLTQDDYITTFYIDVVNNVNSFSGTIIITQFNDKDVDMTNGYGNIPDDMQKYFRQLTIDGKEIIVFGRDNQSYIVYSDTATNYEISLDCDFDTMVSIAETIRVKG